MNARFIQIIALVVMIAGWAVCGRLLSPIRETTETYGLRYTDVSVEGAPPLVVIGTAIGALRGLIVDVLWLKVNHMKEKGLFYEVMSDAALITKLQPRFAAVWAFHGHNMAYNISVATHTQEERWEWVNAGIRLVRNEGLRHNPNDLVLHRELAFWFAHKIEGYADDAHLYYKQMFAREWHYLLGEPPVEHDERITWIQAIADAPATLEEAERRTPGVKDLIAELDAALTPFGEGYRFEPDSTFLVMHGNWLAVKGQSAAAEILGLAQKFEAESPAFGAMDAIAGDPGRRDAWETLLAWVRKRVLIDEYNMSPRLMYEFTRDLGPIDWRHGQAHALYWSRRGSIYGEARVASTEEVYKVLNNDRQQLQAMQDLARYGRITFDPLSTELPSRFPDPRWIDTIDQQFDYFYRKHYDTRGGGGETFITFLENFMSSAVREAYRSGETGRAQRLLDRLHGSFGHLRGAKYTVPIDTFVRNQIAGEVELQPHIGPSEVMASLRYAYRVGVGRNREEVYDQAVLYARQIIDLFQKNENWSFEVAKFGTRRMADLIKDLTSMQQEVFGQLMTDPTIQLQEKFTIWSNIDRFDPALRLYTYDRIAPMLQGQFMSHELSQQRDFDELFPQPPGLEELRERIARQQAEEERRQETTIDGIERRGSRLRPEGEP